MRSTVYYLAPDYDRPSWGVGLLYHHVRLLRSNGIAARVLHHRSPFVITWLDIAGEVPLSYLDSSELVIAEQDILVVPEVLAGDARGIAAGCRRVVFVQGSFLALQPFSEAVAYPDLGFDRAMAVLPHVKQILERHFEIEAQVVPPFLAPYFFADEQELVAAKRYKRVLLFPKPGYREAGYYDWEILGKLLRRASRRRPGWDLLEVIGRPHHEVAALMRTSAFMVNLNCLEAFNTTVPEAMAAGCLPVCYQAYGGRDFLVDRHNAFVFPNNYVYPLAEELLELMDSYDDRRQELDRMRVQAHATACSFRQTVCEQALLDFFAAMDLTP